MTAPARPEFSPADAWVALRNKGFSEKEATRHVFLQIQNQPEAVRAQYLKDIDPGALAAFGLGAADMASFGLGDQVARRLLGETAQMTQEQAQAQHPTAHLAGEVAGLVGPAGVEVGLAKAGKLVPTALRTAASGIRNRTARAIAKTGLNAATGAAYAGAQAAGRTEGSLSERAAAAARNAPFGAVAGGALPVTIAGLGRAIRPATRYVGGVLDDLAGAAPAPRPTTTPMPGLLGVGEDIGAVPMQGRHTRAQIPVDPLDAPTFMRSATTKASLARQSLQELQALFNNTRTPEAMRQLIGEEIARRGAARGLLTP